MCHTSNRGACKLETPESCVFPQSMLLILDRREISVWFDFSSYMFEYPLPQKYNLLLPLNQRCINYPRTFLFWALGPFFFLLWSSLTFRPFLGFNPLNAISSSTGELRCKLAVLSLPPPQDETGQHVPLEKQPCLTKRIGVGNKKSTHQMGMWP